MEELRGARAAGFASQEPLAGAGQSAAAPDGVPAELPTEAAFRLTEQERARLEPRELVRLNVEPSRAVITVLGSLPALRALRPELRQRLPAFDLERFDKLEQYALALQHAHVLHRGSASGGGSLAALAADVTELRDRLLGDARSLAAHGLLDRELPSLCKRSRAYLAIASDVFLLVHSFRQRWPELAGRTPVSLEQLEQANGRSLELISAVGQKANAPEAASESQLARQRAFTLLFQAYEDARRAVRYLRGERGDASEIAPAFYPGRAGRRGKARERARVQGEEAASEVAPALEAVLPLRLPPT